MASCMGIDVYKDTTSRLHGYGRVLLVVKSPAWMPLISSRLFSRCARTSFSNGLRLQHGNRKPMETSGVYFGSLKPFILSVKLENISTDTSLDILVTQNLKT